MQNIKTKSFHCYLTELSSTKVNDSFYRKSLGMWTKGTLPVSLTQAEDVKWAKDNEKRTALFVKHLGKVFSPRLATEDSSDIFNVFAVLCQLFPRSRPTLPGKDKYIVSKLNCKKTFLIQIK